MYKIKLILERGNTYELNGFMDEGEYLFGETKKPLVEFAATLGGFSNLPEEANHSSFFVLSKGVERESILEGIKESHTGYFKDTEGYHVKFTLITEDLTFVRLSSDYLVEEHRHSSGFHIKKKDLVLSLGEIYNHNGDSSPEANIPWHAMHPTLFAMMIRQMQRTISERVDKDDARWPEFFRRGVTVPVI